MQLNIFATKPYYKSIEYIFKNFNQFLKNDMSFIELFCS